MSLGYAEKLSYKEDVGTVGMSEIFDSSVVLQQKVEELALLIKKSKHLVVFTGAGISTSCGIPDFRGPKGIWTLQREGKDLPKASLPFHRAMPSLTHMALVELERAGILKFLISQNVDSLHLRSGIPREKLAELHGNSFREICPSCGLEYIRDFEIETIGMKETSRYCSDSKCGAKLIDTVLDWEDALPPKEMNAAEKHCKIADVVLCLGTSLQITPACNLPLKSIRGGGKVVIVNLQPTPKDKKATLVIHGFVDKVIAGLMKSLNLQIPPYVRIDLIQLALSQSPKRDSTMAFCLSYSPQLFKFGYESSTTLTTFDDDDSGNLYVCWTLRISSIHGQKAPLPFIKSVEVSFPDRPDLKTALLDEQPFSLRRKTKARSFNIMLKFNLIEGCGCPFIIIEWAVDFQVSSKSFDSDEDLIIQNLRASAIEDRSCGQHATVKRRSLLRSELRVDAMVTNILKHDISEEDSKASSPDATPCDNGSTVKRGGEGVNGGQSSPKRPKKP